MHGRGAALIAATPTTRACGGSVVGMQVLADHILRVRAANPGPLTLSGTNSYLVGRDPAWLIDPGPSLPDHVDALLAAFAQRAAFGGGAITDEPRANGKALAVMLAAGCRRWARRRCAACRRHPLRAAACAGDARARGWPLCLPLRGCLLQRRCNPRRGQRLHRAASGSACRLSGGAAASGVA